MKFMTKVKVYGTAAAALFAFSNYSQDPADGITLAPGEVFSPLDEPTRTPTPKDEPSRDCKDFPVNFERPADIPEDTFQAALCAQEIYETPVEILLGVSKIECNHGYGNANDSNNPDKTCRDPGTQNSAGASGPMQFVACSWHIKNGGPNGCWNKPNPVGVWDFNLKEIPSQLSYKGHGKDCDGDGKADVSSVYDSMCAASDFLGPMIKRNGINEALQYYNGGSAKTRNKPATQRYANNVVAIANDLKPIFRR